MAIEMIKSLLNISLKIFIITKLCAFYVVYAENSGIFTAAQEKIPYFLNLCAEGIFTLSFRPCQKSFAYSCSSFGTCRLFFERREKGLGFLQIDLQVQALQPWCERV